VKKIEKQQVLLVSVLKLLINECMRVKYMFLNGWLSRYVLFYAEFLFFIMV